MTYDIESTPYGIRVTLKGHIDEAEIRSMQEDFERELRRQVGSFNVFADHRGVTALPDGVDEQFTDLMAMCNEHGLERSVVVFDSEIAAMQHRRLKEDAGIEQQKVINAEDNPNWERQAREWVADTSSLA